MKSSNLQSTYQESQATQIKLHLAKTGKHPGVQSSMTDYDPSKLYQTSFLNQT